MTDVLSRQVAEILPDKKGLETLMKKKKIRLYLGIDPTGSQLHLGHTIALRKLQQFADLGHETMLVIGTGTVLAGDPSQRDSARPRITEKEIVANIKTWKRQAGKIIDFSKVRVIRNGDWLKKLRLPEILNIASYVSAPRLLERDMFQRRLRRGDTVWVHEMLYPLLQGYDSVVLDVDLEIGGTDQVFNMLVGRELQKKMNNHEKYVLTIPMIFGLDGNPMSKTSKNTVNLTDAPQEMYGKLMSLRDDLVKEYFELCTNVKPKPGSIRDQKAQLAREIVSLYHNKAQADKAEQEFTRVFREKKQPSSIPEFKVKKQQMQLVELLVLGKLATSRSEARRLIEQGGVQINGERVRDVNKKIPYKKGTIIRVGKRNFRKMA
ncbi:tyrosine--tRNA ligase [Patescibacteria group bacterium]|nr:tyrosine--tRNA ligase [Patescibacteria group bacterium]